MGKDHLTLVDLIRAELLEIRIDKSHKVWVNVEGVCRLRIGKAVVISIEMPERRKTFKAPKL